MQAEDVKRIVLQQNDATLDLHSLFCEVIRNQLLIIESVRSEVAPEVLRVAAVAIRAVLYSVDESSDRIRRSSVEIQRL